MKLKIEKRMCADGVEREIIMFRAHWWKSWKPLFCNGRIAYVSYLGISCKSSQDECFDMLGLDEEQRKARESMLECILNADEVYVGARNGNEYSIAYDVVDDDGLETLRNLEE